MTIGARVACKLATCYSFFVLLTILVSFSSCTFVYTIVWFVSCEVTEHSRSPLYVPLSHFISISSNTSAIRVLLIFVFNALSLLFSNVFVLSLSLQSIAVCNKEVRWGCIASDCARGTPCGVSCTVLGCVAELLIVVLMLLLPVVVVIMFVFIAESANGYLNFYWINAARSASMYLSRKAA